MEYVVVEEFDPEAMSKRVDELLDDGWQLYGNLVLAAYYARDGKNQREQHRTIYAQALTKQTPDIPDSIKIRAKTKSRRVKIRP
jgi:hypothetical protein